MRRALLPAILVFLAGIAFGYHNQIGITVGIREMTVRCVFSFSNDSVRIRIPKRAHLTGLSSPGVANLAYFNDRNTILLNDVIRSFQGRIHLNYTLPIPGSEFSESDWMPVPDEKGVFSATVLSPEGERGMFLPYRDRGKDGYILVPEDRPLLFSGRFAVEEGSFKGRKFELAHIARLETPLSNVTRILSGFEKWLFPLEQKTVILVELPVNRGTFSVSGDRLFIVVNNTREEEIGRAFASYYFKKLLGWNDAYSYAFTDLYRRIIDGDGDLKRDEAEWIAAPSDDYYSKVLKKGFGRTEMDRVGVGDLLRNYALLHFCYYTVGLDPFLKIVRNRLASDRSQPDGLEKIFTNSGDSRQAVEFAGAKLLPVANVVPDLILKGTAVYRNMDRIPDVSVLVDGEMREIAWEDRRSFDLGPANGSITVDPYRMVPQMDFLNDRAVFGQKMSAERDLVYRFVLQHRHYAGETPRGVIDLKDFDVPADNAFGLEKGSRAYVAVVRFTAPVKLKLMEGLKELLLTVDTNAKVKVLAERIRF